MAEKETILISHYFLLLLSGKTYYSINYPPGAK